MQFKLVGNWRTVLKHAWSVRASAAAAVFAFGSTYLPVVLAIKPNLWLGALAGMCAVGALFARVVEQKKVSGANDGKQ
jgi:hypothetical protein